MTRCLPLSVLLLAVGCGGGDAISVTGAVKYADGSHIQFENGMVLFQPTAEGRPASGSLEKDGSFTMMTEKPGDGVAPGRYKVVLKV
jgi:hypothetical protein